ncbi:phenylacetic acid degradation operon negative regulatory protein PaaX [Polaromonas sp. P1-6]|nr:phenylacetic acid degradation operon negative regulatory protein PaaX [Polaromonas sp. P1-6]
MRRKISSDQISTKVAKVQRGLVLRANSVLITVYGDAIAPRNQSVWLGSLITLVELFGLSPRLVRTSAFRLTADDWFVATRIGRRSYYGLSEIGLQRVQHADRRIYEFNLPAWDGCWTLVMLDSAMRASARQHLRRELLWEGFGQVSPTLFAHPHADHLSLEEILKAAQAEDQVAVLNASSIEAYSRKPLQTIMHDTFKLTEVELAWKQFIARFAPVVADLQSLSQAEAFFVRTLLIHEYRRVLLRDPNLPEALLPADWPGVQARQLCETLYRGLLASSEQFLCTQVETSDGPFAATPWAIARRLTPVLTPTKT